MARSVLGCKLAPWVQGAGRHREGTPLVVLHGLELAVVVVIVQKAGPGR